MTIEANTKEYAEAIDGALKKLGCSYQKSSGDGVDVFFVFIEDAAAAYVLGTEVMKNLIDNNHDAATRGSATKNLRVKAVNV